MHVHLLRLCECYERRNEEKCQKCAFRSLEVCLYVGTMCQRRYASAVLADRMDFGLSFFMNVGKLMDKKVRHLLW